MKQILALILAFFIVLCATGCSEKKSEHIPTEDEIHEQIRKDLFLDKLPVGEDGRPIYPDSYAGDFWNVLDRWVFLVTDIDQVSEYQYLKDAYLHIEFREEKYSYNYLQSLLDEYESSGEMNPGEMLSIDCLNNRAVVFVEEDAFAEKQFDKDSPLIFKPYVVTFAL